MADATYQPKVYRKQGGDELVVASGGALTLEGDATVVADAGRLLFASALSAAPNGILGGGGTNAAPVISATAKNFLDFRTKQTGATGDLRGLYWRHELSGGASGEAARFVAYGSSATGPDSIHGAHITLSIAAAGKVTGLGAGVRATLETAADAAPGGTLAALQVDSNIGANATLPTRASLIRLAKAGSVDVTTFLDVSDDQCLKGSPATGAASDALKVLLPDGTVRYISLIAAS